MRPQVRFKDKANIPDILLQAIYMNEYIKTKQSTLDHIKKVRPSSWVSSFDRVSSKKGGYKNSPEELYLRIEKLEEDLNNSAIELAATTEKTLAIIDKIDNIILRSLLTFRYLQGLTWEEVAESMDYSYVHIVHRLHPKALDAFKKVAGG